MSEVSLSSKFQIVIPKEIRERLKLKKGQKMQVIAREGLISLVPDQPLEELRGFLKGMDTSGIREEEDRV
ncbi:MAG: AbrB/MazE/SpoVT family DNA-binding domain-containing protein [Actinomycetota bacterium]|nr:AbrB/MazE/SpoVT family DNA-binding domain-containing protein [Actinomycetota bacterium]